MTTRAAAEALLFDVIQMDNEPAENVNITGYIEPAEVDVIQRYNVVNTKTSTKVDKPNRRRVSPIYCPTCRGWVDIRFDPVRLHCRGCGLEAKP